MPGRNLDNLFPGNEDSDHNILTGNEASADGGWECGGIFLKHSNDNSISSNTVKGSGWEGFGIHLDSANNNDIKDNNACCSTRGIYLLSSFNNTIEHKIARDIRLGVFLELGRYNIIKNNAANIQIIDSGPNTVADNAGWVYDGNVWTVSQQRRRIPAANKRGVRVAAA